MTQITRRNMIAAIGAAGAGTCMCGMNSGCATFTKVGKTEALAADAYSVKEKSVRVILAKAPALAEIGGAVKLIDSDLPKPIIIGRIGETDYAVVSLLCPHRGAEVEYRHDEKQFRCASLGHSKFSTDGKLKKGMTKKSLVSYTSALDPDDNKCLVITL